MEFIENIARIDDVDNFQQSIHAFSKRKCIMIGITVINSSGWLIMRINITWEYIFLLIPSCFTTTIRIFCLFRFRISTKWELSIAQFKRNVDVLLEQNGMY